MLSVVAFKTKVFEVSPVERYTWISFVVIIYVLLVMHDIARLAAALTETEYRFDISVSATQPCCGIIELSSSHYFTAQPNKKASARFLPRTR